MACVKITFLAWITHRRVEYLALENHVAAKKVTIKKQVACETSDFWHGFHTIRPKVTVSAGIANLAASLSSFAIKPHTGVALEPSYLVVASSPLPIFVSGLSLLEHTITFFYPCFTDVCSSRACSWVCPVFFSFHHVLLLLCHQCRLFNCLCLGLPHFHLLHHSLNSV